MEVLEYRQKSQVELSTFPDSINTETPRKLSFFIEKTTALYRVTLALVKY